MHAQVMDYLTRFSGLVPGVCVMCAGRGVCVCVLCVCVRVCVCVCVCACVSLSLSPLICLSVPYKAMQRDH